MICIHMIFPWELVKDKNVEGKEQNYKKRENTTSDMVLLLAMEWMKQNFYPDIALYF